jgi:hypothetical protein
VARLLAAARLPVALRLLVVQRRPVHLRARRLVDAAGGEADAGALRLRAEARRRPVRRLTRAAGRVDVQAAAVASRVAAVVAEP